MCVSHCHGLSYTQLSLNNNNSYDLSLSTRVGVTVVPGAAWCSAPMEDTPPCASNLPFPKGGDVRCHKEKMCPGAVKINDCIFCKIPSKCNKVY